MRLIIGLGNPGPKYEDTRHNIGFKVVDALAEKMDISITKTKFNGLYGQGNYKGEKIILLKPLTYMNLSGESVRPFIDYFNIEIDDILVIYDDLDLPVGKVRLRKKGSAGGHNGMKSIIYHLKSDNFKRMRVGIDRPNNKPVVDYVLEPFHRNETELINEVIEHSTKACETWLTEAFDIVMNQFNQ